MLKIPQLTEKDLAIYRDKKVVFFDVEDHQQLTLAVFKRVGIEVIACCVENVSFENLIAIKGSGISIVKPSKLKIFLKRHKNIILQSCRADVDHMLHLQTASKEYGVEFSLIPAGEIVNSFSHLVVFKTLKNPFSFFAIESLLKYTSKRKTDFQWRRFQKARQQEPIILCLPTKTGDVTLHFTFESLRDANKNHATGVTVANVWHRPRFINKEKCEMQFSKVKIIVGIREPIAQNLSAFYQAISGGKIGYNWMCGLLQEKNNRARKQLIEEYERLISEHGDEVQTLWEAYLYRYLPYELKSELYVIPNTIQLFFLELEKYVVDITAYPFNKEKGYTVIKDGNTEIFVYQLEKLNDLVPELSEWIGISFDKLIEGNRAGDKWVGESYKQAQKEIEITQEYFDKCFDEPYVKHCYSEADIEKFKVRWRPHIKKKIAVLSQES